MEISWMERLTLNVWPVVIVNHTSQPQRMTLGHMQIGIFTKHINHPHQIKKLNLSHQVRPRLNFWIEWSEKLFPGLWLGICHSFDDLIMVNIIPPWIGLTFYLRPGPRRVKLMTQYLLLNLSVSFTLDWRYGDA